MGTCCCGTRPDEKFVGVWTDNENSNYVKLLVTDTGRINYQRQTGYSNTSFMGPTRFKDDELFFCCCCCTLRGKYIEEDSQPKLIANGTTLNKIPR